MTTSERETSFVECGRIGRAIGLKGEVAVQWMNGESPVAVGGELFVSTKDGKRPVTVAALRKQGRFSVARFEGVADRPGAEALRGATLFIPEARLPALSANEYYSYELLGIEVVTEDGKPLGKLGRIFNNGAHDVYEVRDAAGREVLIPAVDSIVLSVDLGARRMTVRLLEGMLD